MGDVIDLASQRPHRNCKEVCTECGHEMSVVTRPTSIPLDMLCECSRCHRMAAKATELYFTEGDGTATVVHQTADAKRDGSEGTAVMVYLDDRTFALTPEAAQHLADALGRALVGD